MRKTFATLHLLLAMAFIAAAIEQTAELAAKGLAATLGGKAFCAAIIALAAAWLALACKECRDAFRQ